MIEVALGNERVWGFRRISIRTGTFLMLRFPVGKSEQEKEENVKSQSAQTPTREKQGKVSLTKFFLLLILGTEENEEHSAKLHHQKNPPAWVGACFVSNRLDFCFVLRSY